MTTHASTPPREVPAVPPAPGKVDPIPPEMPQDPDTPKPEDMPPPVPHPPSPPPVTALTDW